MRRGFWIGAGVLVTTAAGPVPGLYEVAVRLELPHVAASPETWVRLCLGADFVPRVLSGNNPLAACPVADLARDAAGVRFTIRCPGGNAARAEGAFVTGPDTFRGRIAMTMGGKNMTMTEVQDGRRLGPCP